MIARMMHWKGRRRFLVGVAAFLTTQMLYSALFHVNKATINVDLSDELRAVLEVPHKYAIADKYDSVFSNPGLKSSSGLHPLENQHAEEMNKYQSTLSPGDDANNVSLLGIAFIQRNETGKEISKETNRSIFFVHIGKAGGTTIIAALKIGCQSRLNPTKRTLCYNTLRKSRLSDLVTSYYHCFHQNFPNKQIFREDQSTSYLFNVRHPVHRAISWYRYINPKGCNRINRKKGTPHCRAAVCQQDMMKPN